MAKTMSKAIANVIILSAVALTCAATAVGIHAVASNNKSPDSSVSPGDNQTTTKKISKIEKTRSAGLIDEFVITYTDDTTSKFLITNGMDGPEMFTGLPDDTGHIPTIELGANGNWVIDGVDQNIHADGIRTGLPTTGRGISKIEKTNTIGLVDEYTITYSDNTTSTFLVTNGENGEQGIQGLRGDDGRTPEIRIGDNGHWFVDNVDSGVNAVGQAGQNGKTAYELAVDGGYNGTLEEWLLTLIGSDGKSAYEIAKENGYTGTEAEWLTTLAGADGMSAYQIYCEEHLDPDPTVEEWLASLEGKSAYQSYCENHPNPDLSESEWLASLAGNGIASITGPVTDGKYDTYTITYTNGSSPTQFVVKNGEDGKDGAALITGAADPLATDGKSGDSYINTTTWEYFTKNGSDWESKGSIRGAIGLNGKSMHAGDAAPTSEIGEAGDSYVDTTSGNLYVKGNSNDWNLIGTLKGPEGASGRGVTTVTKSDETSTTVAFTISYSDGAFDTVTVSRGRSIESITKTSTSDNVDTYTITYNYGEASTFTVTNGTDGKTVYHGETAPDNALGAQDDVYINTSSCEIYFKGMTEWGTPVSFKGSDGKGITSITGPETVGLVDTYTINYSDSTTSTFTVTNGANGKDGTKVVAGTAAPAETDGFQKGDSYINTLNGDYYVLIENASEALEWELRGNIQGAAGSNGINGTKLVTGDADPSATDGYQEGDSFLNTSSWDYFVLTKNASEELEWSNVGNIHNSPNRYTVTFESNGGSAVASVDDALEGKTIAKPTDPTKDGYFFLGWYTSEGNKWSFEKDAINGNTILLARWGQLKVEDGIVTECLATGDVVIPYMYDGQIIEGIAPDLFEENGDITGIELPNTIKEIPENAFSECYSLSRAILPANLRSIGDYAFYHCSSLENVYLPDSIESIGYDAFYACSLESIVLPRNLKTIGEEAFSYCGNAQYLIFPNGCDLKEISRSCFGVCYSLKYIDFGANSRIETIGEYAFLYCSELEYLTLPENLKTIESNAFESACTYVKTLVLPKTIEKIATGAFEGLFYLKKLVFPEDFNTSAKIETDIFSFEELDELVVPYIGFGDLGDEGIGYIMGGYKTIKKLTVTGDRPVYVDALAYEQTIHELVFAGNPSSFEQGCFQSVYEIDYLELPYLGENQSTPTYLSYLFGGSDWSDNSDSEYMPTSLKTVVVRGGQQIHEYAFANCEYIENISINPSTLVLNDGTESHALSGCINLKSLEVGFVGCDPYALAGSNLFRMTSLFAGPAPESLEEIKVTNNRFIIQQSAFKDLTNLKRITLPEGLDSISQYAFQNCGVEHLEIPDSVQSFSDNAFYGCLAKSIKLPNNVHFTYLNRGMFENCRNLGTLIIPDTVTQIGNEAFKGAEIEHVIFGANVSTLGNEAFRNSKVRKVTLNNKLTAIPASTFAGNVVMESINIPSTIATIGDNAFDGCSSLKNVIFEDPVGSTNELSIGSEAFRLCRTLESIVFPTRLKRIGDSAFSQCESLIYFSKMGIGSYSIGDQAFEYCAVLSVLNLANQGVTLGKNCFFGCPSITSVLLPFPITGDETHKGISYLFGAESMIPTSLKTITVGGNLTTLPDYAFSGCSSVTSISVPSTVTTIGDFAFKGCKSLVYLDLPSKVITVGRYAFQSCYSLTSLGAFTETQMGGDLSIGEFAFEGCRSLTRFQFNVNTGNTINISQSAFHGCDSLTIVEFGDSATVGDFAFYECPNLAKILFSEGMSYHLGQSAFSKCYNLAYVENHATDLYIGSNCFSDCVSLSVFAHPESSGTTGTTEAGINEVGTEAFRGCTSLKKIDLKGVTTIEAYGFFGCESLQRVVLPETLETLGMAAFVYCRSLAIVEFAENGVLSSIANFVFSDCISLKSITIPSYISQINSHAFEGCTSLATLTIIRDTDYAITFGQNNVFKNCPITTINYSGTQEQWQSLNFYDNTNIAYGASGVTFNFGYTGN